MYRELENSVVDIPTLQERVKKGNTKVKIQSCCWTVSPQLKIFYAADREQADTVRMLYKDMCQELDEQQLFKNCFYLSNAHPVSIIMSWFGLKWTVLNLGQQGSYRKRTIKFSFTSLASTSRQFRLLKTFRISNQHSSGAGKAHYGLGKGLWWAESASAFPFWRKILEV
jgi:hypothetical protein